jgi:hypothetical protein
MEDRKRSRRNRRPSPSSNESGSDEESERTGTDHEEDDHYGYPESNHQTMELSRALSNAFPSQNRQQRESQRRLPSGNAAETAVQLNHLDVVCGRGFQPDSKREDRFFVTLVVVDVVVVVVVI